ncbi:MAG TPA: hypothetical protein VN740_04105 [Solirubrobacteraceae bacterium]|nr:hypothetical protein [Solirubrobacteraceae bacterium]
MKRFVSIAALLFALAVPAGAGATGAAIPASANGTDVTSLGRVAHDLRLASEFWAIERPALTSPCLSDQVLVTPMQDGIGDNGQIVLASDVWAETALGSCTINVAPVAWALGSSGNSNTSFMLCVLIAHEYGHTLGLPDTETIPMMSSNWGRRDDPLCDRTVYGWRWTLHRDREWLVANRRPLRMARREARRQALMAAEVTAAASGSSSPTTSTAPTTPSSPAPINPTVTSATPPAAPSTNAAATS